MCYMYSKLSYALLIVTVCALCISVALTRVMPKSRPAVICGSISSIDLASDRVAVASHATDRSVQHYRVCRVRDDQDVHGSDLAIVLRLGTLTPEMVEQRLRWRTTADDCHRSSSLLRGMLGNVPLSITVLTWDGVPLRCDRNSPIEAIMIIDGYGYYAFNDVDRPIAGYLTDTSSSF